MVSADRAAREPRSPLVVAGLIAGFVAFALARWALLPGLGFWDTGEFQVVGPVLGTAHPTGFPAYVILGWLASIVFAPLGDAAFRMNLLSAVLVGAAAALTVVLAKQLTGHLVIALAAGLLLAAVPIVWNIGTHADPHALHLALVALLLVLLVGWEDRVRAARRAAAVGPTDIESTTGLAGGVDPVGAHDHGIGSPGSVDGAVGPVSPVGSVGSVRRLAPVGPGVRSGMLRQPGDRWLLAAALVYAIGLANHTLMLLVAPGIALFVLATSPRILRRPRLIVGIGAALVLATVALYLELPLRAGPLRAPLVYGHPETLDGFLYVVLAQQFVGALYQPFADLGDKTAALAQLGFDQLGILVALVPLAFVATLYRRPRYALLTGVSFLITVWFAASYVNADISRYYLGPAVMVVSWLAILAGVVVDLLARALGAETIRGAIRVASPAAVILQIAAAIALLTPTVQALPDRADTVNQSGDTQAHHWADIAMGVFKPDAVVVSWWSYSTTLWYEQIIEGQRPDVTIVDDRTRLDENLGDVTDVIDAELGKRPVYIVRLSGDDLTAILGAYDVRGTDMPTGQAIYEILGKHTP